MTPPSGDDPGAILSDPRIDADHLRLFAADGDPLLAVGAVHDHPASAHRAWRVVSTLSPAVVGVELPGLALPLFERRGRAAPIDGPDAPASDGVGEFGAALAAGAAVGARRVPIDTLGPRFAASLARELRAADADLTAVRRIAGAVASVTGHALSCRCAAVLGDRWPHDPVEGARFEYDLSPDASPERLAEHERRRLSRSRSVLRALERPMADEVVDAARERTMAATLADAAGAGGTVAVVGFDHLDGIADRLADRAFAERSVGPASLRRHWG